MEIPSKADCCLDGVLLAPVEEALLKGDLKTAWRAMLSDLNVCSQKGLVEMFDGSIGAGSVYMPYGWRYQMTETQSMVAKLPVAQKDRTLSL